MITPEVVQLALVIPAAGFGMWLGIAFVDHVWTAWEESAAARAEKGSQ